VKRLEPQIIYDLLYARYGDLNWWPARTAYEVIIGAVLTQNTAWVNVEKAIANFGGGLSPHMIANMDIQDLEDAIRPAGFFRQKARYVRNVMEWFAGYGYDADVVRRGDAGKLRTELLNVKGVGRETADAVLLYAFGLPTFVVDAYTVRMCERLPLPAGENYEAVKAFFEAQLPVDTQLYKNYHAMIVVNGKHFCKKKPACTGCPLADVCMHHRVGLDGTGK